jgi:hypothetical protein
MKGLFRKGFGTAVIVLALGAMLPAVASASTGLTLAASTQVSCPSQQFAQPFASWSDSHWYTLLPGESADSFDGTGWRLYGDAWFGTAKLQDGSLGRVLDLGFQGEAVSPVTCVNSDYPSVRTMIADVSGWQGVAMYVSFFQNGSWTCPVASGIAKSFSSAWSPSVALQIHAQTLGGQTPVRFYLLGTGQRSLYQLYNFYLDPRLSW